MKTRKILTSESVNIGHPDKTCDTIADSFLDAALEQDPNAQMAVECAIKDDLLMIYGEATTTAKIDYEKIAQGVLREIGYTNKFKIIKTVSEQSPEINKAVLNKSGNAKGRGGDRKAPTGEVAANEFGKAESHLPQLAANDQGIAYGYAVAETPEFMPLPIMIAHRLMRRYEEMRKANNSYKPDAKSQVSVEYDEHDPVRIDTILVSVSHSEELTPKQIHEDILTHIIAPVLKDYAGFNRSDVRIIINPSGAFTIWGSHSDSGCVGRKIVVDTYGGVGRVGGGCFSSKNATKIDRSGAYYARYVAKNIVANGLADECEIGVSYAIGMSEPLAINIETFGRNIKPIAEIHKYVADNFDFRPSSIIKELDLLKPQYKATACYGHFGRKEFSWEKFKKTK